MTFSVYSVAPERCRLPRGHEHYGRGNVWNKVLQGVQSCAPVRAETTEFVWALYVDVEEECGEPHELGRGGPGLTMLAGYDLDLMQNPRTYEFCDGTFHRSYGSVLGGLAHELGHGFGLPHPPGCDEGLRSCDHAALMWDGYDAYPNTYLRDDEKAVLLGSPFFGRN